MTTARRTNNLDLLGAITATPQPRLHETTNLPTAPQARHVSPPAAGSTVRSKAGTRNVVTITIEMDPDLRQAAKLWALQNGTTLSDTIRDHLRALTQSDF